MVAVGLKETVTGDTILGSKKLADGLTSLDAFPGLKNIIFLLFKNMNFLLDLDKTEGQKPWVENKMAKKYFL